MQIPSSPPLYNVILRLYDLSNGLAKQLSMSLFKIDIDAIWHTSVEIHGTEYYYQEGIKAVEPGNTHYGSPIRTMNYGTTEVSHDDLKEFLESIQHKYTHAMYNLFTNNCNHFSDDVLLFLVQRNVPKYVSDLPGLVLGNPGFKAWISMMLGMSSDRDKKVD